MRRPALCILSFALLTTSCATHVHPTGWNPCSVHDNPGIEWRGEDTLYGFMTSDAKEIAPPWTFTLAHDFSEGPAAVCVPGPIPESEQIKYRGRSLEQFQRYAKCGYIEKTGKRVWWGWYSHVGSFSEGLAPAARRTSSIDTWGYIDKTGIFVIGASWNYADSFSEGLAPVMQDSMEGKWGYIDKRGRIVIPFQFELALPFSERYKGLATVYLGDEVRAGYIDTTGKFIDEQRARTYPPARRPFCPEGVCRTEQKVICR